MLRVGDGLAYLSAASTTSRKICGRDFPSGTETAVEAAVALTEIFTCFARWAPVGRSFRHENPPKQSLQFRACTSATWVGAK